MSEQTKMQRALDWAISVDVDEARHDLATLRGRHTGSSKRQLAEAIYSGTAWKAAALGAGSGALPPGIGLVAGAAESFKVLRMEIVAAARVALLYDPDFFEVPNAAYILLFPIAGTSFASQTLKELGVRAGKVATRKLIERHLRGEALKVLRRIAAKYFGVQLTRRMVITKVLPVVGALIGATWNLCEVKAQGKRVIAFLEQR